MTFLSPLGFGVSGAHGTPLVPAEQTIALIAEAVRLGVRVFDTAPAYGAGEAERRLGRALSRLDRDDLVVSTKVGLTSSGLAARHRDFSPDGVERSLRASLDRLGVDGVDVVFLHGAAPDEMTASLLNRLKALQSAGAFRALGAAGRGPMSNWALDAGWFSHLMMPVHPFLSAEEHSALERAHQSGVKVWAIETAGDAPPGWRWPRTPADLFPLMKRLRSQPGRGRVSVPEGIAAAWGHPGVKTVMCSTTRPAHLRANLSAAGLSKAE